MNATTLYVEACKCMLYLDAGGQAVWDQLFHLLPRLRQALTCRVCRRLLVDPYGSHNCEHHVCKGCLRKKRSLNPACRWCTNLEKLTEDKQTKIVLACYQKLCEFIAREVPNAQGKPIMPQNGEYNKVFSIIQEAVTSPISLANGLNQQSEEVPDKGPEGESNSQISSAGGNLNRAAESRVAEPKLSPEVERFPPQTLTKDISPSSTGSESSCNKKRKRKPFKGTYYNYNKKKKTSPRQSVSGPDLSCSSEKTVELNSLDSETSCGPSEESEGKEVGGKEIVDIDHLDYREAGSQPEAQKQRTVVMPPGKKRTKGKSKRCSCGTTTKLQSPRCVTTRCPCFSDGGSCESCPCLNCGNPFNNNNNKLLSEDGYQLRFVDEKSLVTSE